MAQNDKRQAILQAALELFAEQGFHGAPTSQLAQKAGVGVGTLYRYFKDKDDLIRDLYRRVREDAVHQIFAEVPKGIPVRDRYLLIMTRILRFFLDNPLQFRFMEQYYFSPFSAGDNDCDPPEANETLRALLLTAREEQIVKQAPVAVLQALAYGPIVALAKEHNNRNLAVDEEMIRQTVEASWDGLAI